MAPATKTKAKRFNIRATEDQKSLVEHAARATHVTSSEFVLRAALREAEDVLASQTTHVLPRDKWNEFVRLIDRPTREIPALKKAAGKPKPFNVR